MSQLVWALVDRQDGRELDLYATEQTALSYVGAQAARYEARPVERDVVFIVTRHARTARGHDLIVEVCGTLTAALRAYVDETRERPGDLFIDVYEVKRNS